MQQFFSITTKAVYKHLLKPLFFLFDPELVHNTMVSSGKMMGQFPPARHLLHWLWAEDSPALARRLNGVRFPNPVGLSAGFDYNGDLTQILPAVGFGFHTIGTVTLKPYGGNRQPRLGRLPKSKALIVNKGLKNDGATEIISRLEKVKFSIPTGISIASTNQKFASDTEQMADITTCFRLFEDSKVKHAYYELNISCPNTFGGEPFTSPERLEKLMKKMDQLKLRKPLYAKMPIDQNEKDTLGMLHVLAKHNVEGVIFGNLTKDKTNPAVLPEDRRIWETRKGNLSGKPTWQRSNNLIALTKKHFPKRFTIIGTGGVFSGADALVKMRAGADIVQLITGMIFEGPQLIGQINSEIARYEKFSTQKVKA